MTESRNDQTNPKVRRLSDAVRRVRIAESERMDAVSDLQDAERARLAALAEALEPVFKDIPLDDDFFICEIGGGMQPRLWVDPTSHVVIGRDRRTYRFLKDTRLGRVVIRETPDPEAMADAVTEYVAEKTVEREQIQEGELLVARLRTVIAGSGGSQPAAETATAAPATAPAPAQALAPIGTAPSQRGYGGTVPNFPPTEDDHPQGRSRGSTVFWMLVAFILGMPAGAFAILAYAWFHAAP